MLILGNKKKGYRVLLRMSQVLGGKEAIVVAVAGSIDRNAWQKTRPGQLYRGCGLNFLGELLEPLSHV